MTTDQAVERKRTPTGRCGGCDDTWWGANIAHCGARGCHQTFSTVSLFDAHRDHRGEHGSCLDPETVDGLEYRDGMWRGPEMSADEKLRAFGKRR